MLNLDKNLKILVNLEEILQNHYIGITRDEQDLDALILLANLNRLKVKFGRTRRNYRLNIFSKIKSKYCQETI